MGVVYLLVLAGSLAVSAAEPGTRIEFAGGTIPVKARAQMDLNRSDWLIFRGGKTELRIEYRKVNTLEYGQNVSRRYAAAILISPLLLLSKARKHFVTLGYVDAEGKQQAVVFRVNKGDIRSVLASLEARTGRRVEYQDDEARKSGKG